MNDTNILEIRGISKSFPGVRALDNVSFTIKKGEVHALCGENGAGKSTLIKILAGAYKCDEGSILFNGSEVKVNSPLEGQKLGISVVHQELRLAENLSVAENIFLGRPKLKTVMGIEMVDWDKLHKGAKELLDRLGISMDLKQTVKELSIAQKQIIEIAKALSFKSDMIIMDEPSATLTEKELSILFNIITHLRDDGVTIIYISHRLAEIFKIADRVTVLRDGRYIGTMNVRDATKQQLITMMVGRNLENEYPKVCCRTNDEMLKVRNLNRKGVLKDISFTAYKGEILGIAGLVGSGRTELARAVFGADPIDSGEVYINGEKVNMRNVRDAIRLNMALVPEDRKGQGLVLGMSVRENITVVGLKRLIRKGLISRREEYLLGTNFVSKLKIKTPDLEKEVKELSGGNQQKVVLAKWLMVNSDIIIFDEPTRGIDVGAKSEIYELLNNLASQGKTIIMISSELQEIIGMCDRIIVMHDGRITGELDRGEASQEKILHYAII